MAVLLKLPEVRERVALSTPTIYRLIKKGDFPRPVHLGPRAVAWVEDEVETWIEQRIEASRAQGVA